MELIQDDVTHIAKSITFDPSIILDGVEHSKNIFEHAQLTRYNIYQLTGVEDTEDEGKVTYGIIKKDFDTYWCIKNKSKIIASDHNNNISLYIGLTQHTLDTAHKATPTKEKNNIHLYFIQRMLWPEDQDIINRPAKKLEYEAGYHLFKGLADRMTITFQTNFLNYHVDILFELRDSLDLDLPKIGVEIDEGFEEGHNNYDKDDEKTREEVVKYFDNILYRIPIKRTHTSTDIKEIVDKFVKNIIQKADDMLITYNPNISQQELEKELLKHNYSNHIIAHFLANHNTGDPLFCLRHDVVAKELGYGKSGNYKEFRTLIRKIFTVNIDYKIRKYKSILRLGGGPSNLGDDKNNNNIPRLEGPPPNLVGTDLRSFNSSQTQKQIIIFSRSTFHRLCIASIKPKAREIANSFCRMYEILFKYIIASRQQVVTHNRENKAHEPSVKNRVIKLVKQRNSMTLNNRLRGEVEDYQKKYEKFKKKYDNNEQIIKEHKETIDDLVNKLNVSEVENTEYLSTIKKLKKRCEIFTRIKSRLNGIVAKYNDLLLKYKSQEKELEEERKKNIEKDEEITRLKQLLDTKDKEKTITVKSKKIKLIIKKKLKVKPTEVVVNPVIEEDPVIEPNYTKKQLVIKTVKELKDICKTNGIGGYSGKTKSVLIDWMMTKEKIMYN